MALVKDASMEVGCENRTSTNENGVSLMEEKALMLDKTDMVKADEFPKLSDSDKLAMFGNDKELLTYYLGISEAMAEARRQKLQCFCDPRDTGMMAKLLQEGWKPKLILKDLKDEENTDLGLTSKQTALDDSVSRDASDLESDGENDATEKAADGTDAEDSSKSFVCGVQGCSAHFTSLASYESHYHTSHNFVCHMCRRTFVSNFFLDVHLEENHDSYFQILSPKVDMYRCLVEGCSLKFRTADMRKDHLITAHKFPAKFLFHGPINEKAQKSKRSKARSSKYRKSKSNNVSSNEMETSRPSLETSPSLVCSEMNSVDFSSQPSKSSAEGMESPMMEDQGRPQADCVKVKRGGRGSGCGTGRGKGGRAPANICFGRSSQRAFQRGSGNRGRHWHQIRGMDVDTTIDIEKVDFTDMAESLEDNV
ncbi:Zinc finger protein 511 [Plakobranchus ocellatus]|uniref:Zinc finger protein 511 n=1 Tax=Plakobranchus ocellatus TaxID=259542 RepID=A0AAV4C7F9_9GAST|nr:Zinc finger protein 511 [Plakobranchus ocellatus]